MCDPDYPDCSFIEFVNQPVVLVCHILTSAGRAARRSKFRELLQPRSRLVEPLFHTDCGNGIVLSDEAPDRYTVFQCLWRPYELQVCRNIAAHQSADSTSTCSFGMPMPARMEALPSSTIC